MNKISPRIFALSLLVLFGIAGPLRAQIAYVSVDQNGSLQLHQMNADGAGDTAIPLRFTTFEFPTWSRNGRLLAITASDPASPNQRGQNVFAIDTATGATRAITFLNDVPNPGGNVIYTYPYYKAFSPDGSAMAVFSRQQLGGVAGTSTTTPVLEVYPTNGGAEPVQVHIDKGLNGKHHGGEGVDWSPTANVLVAPVQGSAAFLSGGGPGDVTALALLDPVPGAALQGRTRQLTFPRADGSAGQGNGAFVWGEHDYQPKFSPNGRGVAYVRSFQNFNLLSSSAPDPDVQSLRIVDTQTGADSRVVQFQPGFYVTTLDWSPDGTQLVFDIGQQLPGPLGPQQQVNPQTVEIYAVNVDGSGLRRLRGPGSGTPAWSRNTAPQQPVTFGNISTRMRVGSGDSAMIGGFIIAGSESKKVIIRGMGPLLGTLGVQGALTDPFLELHDGTGAIVATNDNWQQAPNTNEIPSGFAPADPRESVIVTTLAPGSYTAVVRGAHGETGVGIFEAYDLTQSATSKLANISTRGFVETGDGAMIGGLIMSGGSTKVIVRAIGPSLQNIGIRNALQDPTLELINGNGSSVASNDNWQQAPNTNEIPNGFSPSDPRESVIVTTLSAGSYTAIVRGKNDTVGIAVVEAYNLQ
jgi:hypothetical protein